MGCASHRSLSLAIGWFNIVLSIVSFISVLICWFVFDVPRIHRDVWAYGEHWEYGRTLFVLIVSYIVVWFIISVLLVKGINENNHRYMAPWVYLNTVIVAFLVLLTIYNILYAVIQGLSFVIILFAFIINCLSVGLGLLILYPVYMLFRKIRKIRISSEHPHDISSSGMVCA